MFNAMFRKPARNIVAWYKKNRNYSRSRRLSDHRATSQAVEQIITGALNNARLNGCPLERARS